MTPPLPTVILQAGDSRATLVRADAAALDEALRPLVPDATRTALIERLVATEQTRTQHLNLGVPLTAIAHAAGAPPPDIAGRIALEVVLDGRAIVPLWPLDAPAAEVIAWLGNAAPDPVAASGTSEQIRAWFGRETGGEDSAIDVALAAHAWLAHRALEHDRARPFVALDAGSAHHALLGGLRDLPKSRKRQAAATVREGWAEILHPKQQLALRLNVQDLPVRIVEAIKAWRSWQGLRHWAALQVLFTDAGRTGRIRWTLEGHLDVLGYRDRARRDPKVRDTVAAEVEALTRMEVAVYHPDGTLRARGPILAITQRGEALRGSKWALEGLELVIHPVLYEGVRRENGEIGKLWAPAPAELAKIDHARHPHALALGLILPIRWRWDTADGCDHVGLTGAKLLEAAGISRSGHDPGRAWSTLGRTLTVLQKVGGLGKVEWDHGAKNTAGGMCRLYPPQWVRERLVYGIVPAELPPPEKLLTGGELATWRTARGWTQAQTAATLGVGVATVKRAEATPDEPLKPALRDALPRLR